MLLCSSCSSITFFSGSYYFVCQGIKEIKPVPDWTWPGLQARTTLRQSGESGTSRRPQNEWFWRRWQIWWGYWWCIKEIQTVPDCLRPGLQTETTWRPGWPHQERQEHQEDPRMGDFGWDGSLDGVIVKVSGGFNLFWIAHGQGYKLGPPGPHQEHQERQEDPRMEDFGGEGSLDGVIVRVSRRFNLFWIARGQNYKLRPPGDLADPIRNFKKTPGWVILVETAVLMGYCQGIKDIQPVLDSPWLGLQTGTTWMPR